MKKYKLLKWYPGCGEQIVGDIITSTNCSSPLYAGKKLTDTLYIIFSAKDVENNPEYWEEVINKNPLKLEVGKEYILQYVHSKSKPQHVKITHFTDQGYPWQERVKDGGCKGIVSPDCYRLIEEVVVKDYEILSIMSKTPGKHVRTITNGFVDALPSSRYEEFLKDDLYEIHIVKRLSDGEVFTINDRARPKKCNPNNFIITGFTLDCNNKHILALGGNGGININKLKPIKKPLFKTSDGVDIYEGDRYYGVELGIYRFINDIACKNVTYTNTGNIYFSTKEAAEEYILMNKPCLSMQDLKITGCLNEKQWFAILDLVKYKSKL